MKSGCNCAVELAPRDLSCPHLKRSHGTSICTPHDLLEMCTPEAFGFGQRDSVPQGVQLQYKGSTMINTRVIDATAGNRTHQKTGF